MLFKAHDASVINESFAWQHWIQTHKLFLDKVLLVAISGFKAKNSSSNRSFNHKPLQINTYSLQKIKTTLICDSLNLIGITPYDRKLYEKELENVLKKRLLGLDKQTT